jgi:pyrroloquinoline quinone biosynthesis protein D
VTERPPDGLPARLDAGAIPRLKSHVRLQFSAPRGQWIVQAPERVLMPDDIAVAVLKRCDGSASVSAIAQALAVEYNAPVDVVTNDVLELLQDLAEKGIIADAGA